MGGIECAVARVRARLPWRPFAGGLAVIVLWAAIGAQVASAQEPPAEGDFEKVTLDDNTANPMELDVAPDGRVFYIERSGQLRVITTDGSVVTAGAVPEVTAPAPHPRAGRV
jgi:hypothetical protein